MPIRPIPEDRRGLANTLGLREDKAILFYSGGVYAAGGRRVDKVIEALQYLPSVEFAVVGFMNDSVRAGLLNLADTLGVRGRLHLLEPCDGARLHDLAASASVGIIPLAGTDKNTTMSALNKLSEYLVAGLPIAATGYANLKAVLETHPRGPVGRTFDVADSTSIAAAVQWLLDPDRCQMLRENALRLGREEYNWDAEKHVLVTLYARLAKEREVLA